MYAAIYSFACIGFIQFGVWVYAIINADLSGMSGRFSCEGIDPHRVPVTGDPNGKDCIAEDSVVSDER
jgi:hypothetical protein